MTILLSLIPYMLWNIYVRYQFSRIEQKCQMAFERKA